MPHYGTLAAADAQGQPAFRLNPMPKIEAADLTPEDILKVVDYFPETGRFSWKITTKGYGKAMYPGDEAGWTHAQGYRVLSLYQGEYRAHRVAWFIMSGKWPPRGFDIDHANRDRGDNSWRNLRLATRSQNNINSKLRSDNTSGVRGVHRSRTGKWFARIGVNGRVKGLGTFETFDEAVEARKKAELEMFGNFSTLRDAA